MKVKDINQVDRKLVEYVFQKKLYMIPISVPSKDSHLMLMMVNEELKKEGDLTEKLSKSYKHTNLQWNKDGQKRKPPT